MYLSHRRLAFILCAGLAVATGDAQAQFSSGSNGTDGALVIAPSQSVVEFDPVALGIDQDDDGVYHFTTISVGGGTTLRMRANFNRQTQGRPVVWLASGAVTIDGTIDLNGERGHAWNAVPQAAIAGAGGFNGGVGGTPGADTPTGGHGPGGGSAIAGQAGGHAGHFIAGGGQRAGDAYGNMFLFPPLGGSGGGGGATGVTNPGAGGGAGGGAIVIASSVSIALVGRIEARGGSAGTANGGLAGGHGSGGSIRLVAPTLSGAGTLNVDRSSLAGPGRVRLEGFTISNAFQRFPTTVVTTAAPVSVFPPASAPSVRVTEVGGVAVAASPTGDYAMPDVVINTANPITITIAASNVPLGTTATVRMVSQQGATMNFVSSALAGTFAQSTATAGPLTVPAGFTRFSVSASW